MLLKKISTTVIFICTAAAAIDTDSTRVAETEALLQDIKNNLSDYMDMVTNSVDFLVPNGLVGVKNQFDSNGRYTGSLSALESNVDLDAVDSMVHRVPWYSTRLLPLINSFLSEDAMSLGITATTSPSQNSTVVTSAGNQTFSTPLSTTVIEQNKTSSSLSIEPNENGALSPLTGGMVALLVGCAAMIL